MVVRVTVTLPEDILGKLDAIARDESVTRSDVVREAAADYVVSHAESMVSKRREAAVLDGLAWLEGIALRTVSDTRPSLEILRELRGTRSLAGDPIRPEAAETELP